MGAFSEDSAFADEGEKKTNEPGASTDGSLGDYFVSTALTLVI